MPDQVKDFQYYATKAENALRDAKNAHNAEGREAWAHVAQAYARLAAAAPEPAPQRVELHDAACPCITAKWGRD